VTATAAPDHAHRADQADQAERAAHGAEHAPDPVSSLADELVHHVARLSRTLSTTPNDETLLQAVVLDFPARFGVASAMLCRTRNDGSLAATAWYGFPELAGVVEPFDPTTAPGVGHVLRTREPHVWPTVDSLLATFPELADGRMRPRAGACIRLEHHGVPIGTLGLGVADDVQDIAQMRRLMTVTAAVVGAHLALAARAIPRQDRERPSTADDVRLTTRQLAVLGLMAEGMSNRQISLRVGYSESTVRHETMAIYRALGVGDRRTAALLALELGLVG
jgi:DNA-binding CsgD family transcriptional regulator